MAQQQVGFTLELGQGFQAQMRVRQYYNNSEDLFYDVVSWKNITTGGAQSLTINVDKNAVANAGKTILEVKFLPPRGQQTFPRNTTPIIDRPWLTNTTLVPENRVVTVCDEKDQYRFGFNGMEKDNEAKGLGNSLDFGARILDTRIARLGMSVDPLFKDYPSQSPYLYAGNNPIFYIDENGEKKTTYLTIVDERSGTTTIIKMVAPGLIARSTKSMHSEIRTWNWFDYSQDVKVTINKDGKVTSEFSEPVVGAYRTNTFFRSEMAAREDVGENKVKDKRTFGGWIGTSSSGGGDDNNFNPSAGNGSRFVDYGSLLNAFKMVNMTNNNYGPDGILSAINYLNNAVDAALDESKPLTPVTINGRSSGKVKVEQCESCGTYGQDGQIIDDTSGMGITPENTERKSLEQFHGNNR